jgi:predicted ferric reductase
MIVGVFSLVSFVGSTQPAYAETTSGTNIVVQTIPGPSVAQKLADRAHTSWSWYVSRGSGIIAAIAIVLLLLSGIGQVTGYTFRFLEPIVAWASHRALGIIGGIAILVHMFSLLFDTFVPFTVLELFVPWLSHYKPILLFGISVGSLWVALGVLAFYLVVIIIFVSLLWIQKKPLLWKWTHLASYIVMLFIFIHALYLGTDLQGGVLRFVWLGIAALIVLATIYRAWRAKTI